MNIPNKAKTNNTMTNANKPVNNVTNNNITEKVSTLKQKSTDYNHFAKTQDILW